VCDNCLNKITRQDEQDIQNSKAPVSQSDLASDQQTLQPESNPNPSGSANPTEPPSENSPSPESSGSGSSGGGGGGDVGGGGGGEGG
jgi:uncharacterized membrane protein